MPRGDNNKARAACHERRILALLADHPMTLRQLATATGLSLDSMYLYRDRLREPKRIFVIGHDHTGARPAPLYAAGDRADAVYDALRKPKLAEDRVTKQRRRLRELLAEAAQTAEQVGLRLHLSTSRARTYISELHNATPKQAFIVRWQHPGGRGDLAPVYALGSKPDAPKPRESRAERYRKERADADQYDRITSKRRLRHAIERARRTPATWLTALGA